MCPLTHGGHRPTNGSSALPSYFQSEPIMLLVVPLLRSDRIVFGYFSGLVAVVWGQLKPSNLGSMMVAFSVPHM